MLSDTHPEAEKVLVELLRKATVAERVARMRSLTTTVVRLSRRAIAEASPELSPREADLKWVELCYGKQLAAEVRDYLRRE